MNKRAKKKQMTTFERDNIMAKMAPQLDYAVRFIFLRFFFIPLILLIKQFISNMLDTCSQNGYCDLPMLKHLNTFL